MNRNEMLAELRNVVGDEVVPYGWADTRLLFLLSQGQDEFCKLTGFWTDRSTYTLTTVAGQVDYDINSRIIAVRSVWDGNRKLVDTTGMTLSDTDFFDASNQSPVHYRIDLETGKLTLLEPPAAGIVLSLTVHRKSKKALNEATGEPEIPVDFHLAPIEYAAAKALGDHDRELQDPVKAADHMANFKVYVKEGGKAYRRLTGDYADIVPSPLYVV